MSLFKFGRADTSVLDHAMKVHAPPYSTVMALHDKLCVSPREC